MIGNLYQWINSIGLLFLIVSSGYSKNLLSCGLQDYLRNDMFGKHIFTFVLILLFVLLFSSKEGPVDNTWLFPEVFLSAFVIYVCFILMGKLQPSYIIIILIGIVIHMMLSRETPNKDPDIQEVLNLAKFFIICFIGFVLVLGICVYIYKQNKEYGENFDIVKFMFGTPMCSRFKV